ncbi:hypothetical protein V8B97DRAFT_709794 [Scleroderma yunnanense]
MLSPSRNHRAVAKYNVTTEFPYLGLHSAAASGDIGLVQYALSHGQPVNSVLDGVLPLHAACAGGNDLVVKLLIKHGADVNAERLPRRYSDRSRDVTAPIVGTSGSTPLHFAAANGHSSVVRTLLAQGATPDRADKHGVTPEHIARENGWIECAELLAECAASMREKWRLEGDHTSDSNNAGKERGAQCSIEHLESSLRKRLNFKRSIDHTLGVLKNGNSIPEAELKSVFLHPNLSEQDQVKSPESYSVPLILPDASGRRPSLTHIEGEPALRSSFSPRSRRPRSAGTGAEVASPRKLHSKLSLLSLFRKSNVDGSSSSVASTSEQIARSPPPSSPIPFASSPTSGSIGLPVSPRNYSVSLSSSPRDISQVESQRRRMENNSPPQGARAYPPHPTDSQNPFTGTCSGNRSVSGTTTTSGPGEESASDNAPSSSSGAPTRPGILRMHNRSSSSGYGTSAQSVSSPRIIRFQSSTSSISSLGGRSRNPSGRGGQSLRSMNLSSGGQREDEYDGIPDTIEESPVVPPQPTPPIFVNIADEEDEPEEEYGMPLDNTTFPSDPLHLLDSPSAGPELPFSIKVPPPTDDPAELSPTLENRIRGDSISSAGTMGTTGTCPPSSSSETAWSVGTPGTPHLSPGPVIASALGEVDTENGLPRRRKPLLLDVDISTISSHAQAEELVQRAQQSILNMEQYFTENTKKDTETGRTPLSVKLAEYGESLAIERRLKEANTLDEKNVTDGKGDRRSLLSATKPLTDNLSKSAGVRVSLDETPSFEEDQDHIRRIAQSASDDIRDASSFNRPVPGGTGRLLYTPPPSRIPDVDLDPNMMGNPSFAGSTTTMKFPRSHSRDRDPTRSAQKLSRMGFSTMDSWQPSSLNGEVARSPPPKHLFGGIRTLMQSFQGK